MLAFGQYIVYPSFAAGDDVVMNLNWEQTVHKGSHHSSEGGCFAQVILLLSARTSEILLAFIHVIYLHAASYAYFGHEFYSSPSPSLSSSAQCSNLTDHLHLESYSTYIESQSMCVIARDSLNF